MGNDMFLSLTRSKLISCPYLPCVEAFALWDVDQLGGNRGVDCDPGFDYDVHGAFGDPLATRETAPHCQSSFPGVKILRCGQFFTPIL